MLINSYPEIKSGTPDAVLAGIWRIILKDYSVDPARLDDLINQYSKRMTHLNVQERNQFYGNVLSDLRSDQMTWKTFRRGPMVLGVKRMTMEFTLHHLKCSTTHKLVIEYGKPNEPEDTGDANGQKSPTDLSRFFTNVMHELGVSVTQFNSLLTSYMRRMRIPVTPVNRTYVRGNFKKEFTGKRLSWASLIRGLDFLTIAKFDIKITLDYEGRRKRQSVHSTPIILNDVEDMMADMDESDFLQPSFYESTPNDSPEQPS